MIIQCVHCGSRYKINPKIVEPSGRHLRCSTCRSIFFQPPLGRGKAVKVEPKPSKAVEEETVHLSPHDSMDGLSPLPGSKQQDRRRNDRLFLQARAEIRLEKGFLYRGVTQDLGTGGVTFICDTPPLDVEEADVGIFSFILEDGTKEYFTEFACKVIYVDGRNIGVNFTDNKKGVATLRNENFDLVRPGARVYVRRKQGSLEGGWEVLPPDAPIPANIRQNVMEKEKSGSCCVCVKRGEGAEKIYKVYLKLDLVAIQLAAKNSGLPN